MIKKAGYTLCVALLSALAACSSDDKERDEALRVCPRAGILIDAAKMIEFAPGEGRSVDDVAYDVEFGEISTKCKYEDNIIKAKVNVGADLWAGRAAPLGKKQFRFFVAVTELNTAVVDKQYYTVEADFSKSSRRYVTREIKDIVVPYKKLGRGDLYEILVGWDLTPEQLQYNRSVTPFDRPNIKEIPEQ